MSLPHEIPKQVLDDGLSAGLRAFFGADLALRRSLRAFFRENRSLIDFLADGQLRKNGAGEKHFEHFS